jgi:ACDE family multidrug resistance protein
MAGVQIHNLSQQCTSCQEALAQLKELKTIAILCTVPFIMVLGNSMLIPVLPTIQKQLSISSSQAGLLITMFSIPAGLVIPFAGLVSDRVGRKPIMVPAIIVYGIGGLLAGLAAVFIKKPFYFLLAARIIQGIGAGGTYQLAMALVGDVIQGSDRAQALGLLEASNGLGKVISPLAGAALALITWYTPFFVYGVLALPIALAVWLIAKEAPVKKAEQQSLSEYFKCFAEVIRKNAAVLAMTFISGAIVLFALFGMLSYFSDILEKRFGFEVFQRGLILAIPVFVMAVVSYLLGTVLKAHMSKFLKWAVLGGLSALAAGMFLFPLLNNAVIFSIAASLIGFGTGAVLPSLNTLATSVTDKKSRGIVTCLYGTVRFFGVAIGPPLFGNCLKNEQIERTVFWITAAAALIIGLCAAFVVNPQKALPESIKSDD